MTPLERAIAEAVSTAKGKGLEPKSVYLRPEDLEELGAPAEIGGLTVKRISGKGKPVLYCRHGIAVTISLRTAGKCAPRLRKGEKAYLISLLNGWPVHDVDADRRLRAASLVAGRPVRRKLHGRAHTIEEPRLTGRGEEAAKRLWEGLDRAGRAELRAQAMRAGL